MPLFRISLGFAKLADPDLDDFATNIAAKLTANATLFTGMTANVTALTTAQGNFHTSLAAAKGGGKAATADKNAKRAIVENLLRQLAFAVQSISTLSPNDAAKSGFGVVVAGAHAPVTVDVPVILDVSNVASTKLGLKIQAPKGFQTIEIRGQAGTNAPVLLGSFSSTRGMVLENLVPGTLYTLQARAGFGGKRFSDWSDPVAHMCT